MGSVKHVFESEAPASSDPAKVGGPEWNADHALDLEIGDVTGLVAALANKHPLVAGIALCSNRDFGTLAPANRAAVASNWQVFVAVPVIGPCTITGIRYRKGTGTSSANVRSALYDISGAKVADRTSNFAQGTSASVTREVPFDDAYSLTEPGIYFASLIWSSTAGDFMGWAASNDYLGPSAGATQGSFVTASSFSPPDLTSAGNVVTPFLVLY